MRTMIVVAAALCALPALAGNPEAEGRRVQEAFTQAGSIPDPKQSVEAVLKLFTENAQHIGIFGRIHGKAEFKQVLPVAFSAPGRKTTLTSHEARVLDAKHLVSIAHFNHQFVGPDGKQVEMKLRCLRVLEKQKDGSYLIAAEHTSFGPPAPTR